MAAKQFSYSKTEKLKSSKMLKQVFATGQSIQNYPLKLTYTLTPAENQQLPKVAVGVSSRHFKKAVDRNRVKRILRESYRLQKHLLIQSLPTAAQVNIFILFTGKDLKETALITEKIQIAFEKLSERLNNKKSN